MGAQDLSPPLGGSLAHTCDTVVRLSSMHSGVIFASLVIKSKRRHGRRLRAPAMMHMQSRSERRPTSSSLIDIAWHSDKRAQTPFRRRAWASFRIETSKPHDALGGKQRTTVAAVSRRDFNTSTFACSSNNIWRIPRSYTHHIQVGEPETNIANNTANQPSHPPQCLRERRSC